jgi:cytidylate kinase
VDERPTSWLAECVSNLVDRDHVASDAYQKHLAAVVRALGALGRCIIVGRGANFLLPPESTLSVRLVATPKVRTEAIARRTGMTPTEAEAWMNQTDRERAAFFRHTFGQDPADPLHYDLIVNVSRLSATEAAGVIVETLRHREGHGRAASQPQQGRAGRDEVPASPALA